MFQAKSSKSNLLSVRDFFDDFIEAFLGVDSSLQELNYFKELHPLQVFAPKYPKTNWAIMQDGSSVFEFAFTGVDRKDIKVEVDNNVLTVSTNTDEEEQIKGYYVIRDLAKRKATVSIRLSDKTDTDKIQSTYKDGLLTVTIPLKESEKPQKKVVMIG